MIDLIRPTILALHEEIRDAVVSACERQSSEQLAAVAGEDESDTIYAIDRIGEDTLTAGLSRWAEENVPIVLIAEGIADGHLVLPLGADEERAGLRVIVDPIDGTRGLMYQKRSAWILTGVAPNRGPSTGLQDIALSIMTEIPLVRQHLSDQGWAGNSDSPRWTRINRLTGERKPVVLTPSTAPSIDHGFATVFRPFPGARDVLAGLDDRLVRRVLGPQPAGKALCFEDQYASTGGQMYELLAGRDRFVADLRPLVHPIQEERGEPPCICAHPYDAAGYLLATAGGVVITGVDGGALEAPLDTTADVGWIGYANENVRATIEPHLLELIDEFGMRATG